MEPMQQDDKESNVVQLRDYAQRRTPGGRRDTAAPCCSASQSGRLLTWPRFRAAYPGGIDDLPV